MWGVSFLSIEDKRETRFFLEGDLRVICQV